MPNLPTQLMLLPEICFYPEFLSLYTVLYECLQSSDELHVFKRALAIKIEQKI